MVNNIFENNTEITGEESTNEPMPVLDDAGTQRGNGFQHMVKKITGMPKKVWIPVASAVVFLAVAISLLSGILTNTYRTPINRLMAISNKKNTSNIMKTHVRQLNGFSEKEVTAFLKAAQACDTYEDMLDTMKDQQERQVETWEDQYGSNYSFSYEIEDKEKLEKSDLREARDYIKNIAKEIKDVIDATEDFDSDDWEDAADSLGCSKSEAKKLIKSMENVYKVWKNADVSAGYELSLIIIVDGRDLDEPEESETSVNVFKVNGRWVSADAIRFCSSIRSYILSAQ